MKRYTLLSLFLLTISLLTFNCQKEGPAGPAGATGASGPDGTTGATGPAGTPGTANVIYSGWFSDSTFSPSWADTVLQGGLFSVSRAIKAAPGVTQTIIDQGLVLTYQKAGTLVQLLPLTFSGNSIGLPGSTLQLDFFLNVGKIIYYWNDIATGNLSGFASSGFQYRYLIIPGGVSGGRMANGRTVNYSTEQLKAMSYDEIRTLFNIPENGQRGV